MFDPIYKLSFYRRTDRAFSLTPEEQSVLLAKREAAGQSVGQKTLLTAAMGWSNEQFEYFSVELFPNLDALRAYKISLEGIGWYSLFSSVTYLGIPMDDRLNALEALPSAAGGRKPIYRVYLSRPSPLAYGLPPEEHDEMLRRTQEAAQVAGSKPVLSAYTRWNNEEWEYFGVEQFPSTEDALRYTQYLSVSSWYRYTVSRSYLGDPVEGLLCRE